MANTGGTQGGSHEQHVKAGEQSHKNTGTAPNKSASSGPGHEKSSPGTRSGGSEQHTKPGQQGHKNS
jgi:hypothetical protein